MSFKIKDPDRRLALENPIFMSKTERAWLFAEEHRSAIIGGTLALCLIAAGLGGLFWYQHDQNRQAMTLQLEAAALYLDRPLDDLEQSKQNLDKAITLFQQVLQQYPSSPSTDLAQYFIGNARVEQQDYPAAISTYQTYIQNHQPNPILLGLVYQRLGSAYLLNKDRSKAMEAFTTVLDMPGAANKDQVLFELAKMELAENSNDQALSYYKRLLEHYDFSPYAGEAALQVKALEPQPAAAPTAAEAEANKASTENTGLDSKGKE